METLLCRQCGIRYDTETFTRCPTCFAPGRPMTPTALASFAAGVLTREAHWELLAALHWAYDERNKK